MSARRRVLLLGSTGSIGTQTLDVIAANPNRFEVVGLAAGRNRALLDEQAERFGVRALAQGSEAAEALVRDVEADVIVNGITGAAGRNRALLDQQAERFEVRALAQGSEAAEALVRDVEADVIVNGITGAAGLGPTIAALGTDAVLALANKESLIIGAPVVKPLMTPGRVAPVDSEHSAIAQCLASGTHGEIRRLVLTASGGAFRGRSRKSLVNVQPSEALAHPTWDMGLMVTTNTATLVNKGLEVIEAHLLFDVPFAAIDVVVHPQSVIHSMVEFVDGATIAQASPPDMRLPISLALDPPHRIPGVGAPLDWTVAQSWSFEPLDEDAFPSVALAKLVGEAGGTRPAVFNAANEQAVWAFHAGRLAFLDIVPVIEAALATVPEPPGAVDLPAVMEADRQAREAADAVIASSGGS